MPCLPASDLGPCTLSAQDELENNHSTCACSHFTLNSLLFLDASRLQTLSSSSPFCVKQSRGGKKASRVGVDESDCHHMGSWSTALGAASWLPCLPASHFSSSFSKLIASLSRLRMTTLHELRAQPLNEGQSNVTPYSNVQPRSPVGSRSV